MVDRLLYELTVVEEESVAVEVESAGGALTWAQNWAVDRLVHEEFLPSDFDPQNRDTLPPYKERLERLIRGAAWERFAAYLHRSALNAGLPWLLLNLEEGEHAFLFSTRVQERLAEALGFESGAVGGQEQQFFVLTDRRIDDGTCFCLKTKNHRIFARYELVGAVLRVYMSEVVRVGNRFSIVQLSVEEAVQYLRSVGRDSLPRPSSELLLPPASGGREIVSVAGSAPTHGHGEFEQPSQPGSLRGSMRDEKELIEPDLPRQPNERQRDPVPDARSMARPSAAGRKCPECGGDLFALSDTVSFCLSCDWSDLPQLD